jgi:hypothetical protein
MFDLEILAIAQRMAHKVTPPARMVGNDLPMWSETGKNRWDFEKLQVYGNPGYKSAAQSAIATAKRKTVSGTCDNDGGNKK